MNGNHDNIDYTTSCSSNGFDIELFAATESTNTYKVSASVESIHTLASETTHLHHFPLRTTSMLTVIDPAQLEVIFPLIPLYYNHKDIMTC